MSGMVLGMKHQRHIKLEPNPHQSKSVDKTYQGHYVWVCGCALHHNSTSKRVPFIFLTYLLQ